MMTCPSLIVCLMLALLSGAKCDTPRPKLIVDSSDCRPLSYEVFFKLIGIVEAGQKYIGGINGTCREHLKLDIFFSNTSTFSSSDNDCLNEFRQFTFEIPVVIQEMTEMIVLNYSNYQETRVHLEEELADISESILHFSKATPAHLKNISIILQNSFYCYLKAIEKRLAAVEKVEEVVESETASFIAALLLPARPDIAQKLFYQIEDDDLIAPTMESLYGDRNEYFDGPAEFIGILLTSHQRLIAYREWFSLVERNADMLSYGIIVLRRMVTNELEKGKITNESSYMLNELEEMKAKLDMYKSMVVSLWVIHIQNGAGGKIAEFGSPRILHRVGYIFEELLSEVIDKVIGPRDSSLQFLTALEFATKLNWNSQRYTALRHLYDIADNHQRMLVTLRIKEAMETLDGPDSSRDSHAKFGELIDKLPRNLRNLIWKQSCYIKNKDKQEYIYCDQYSSARCFTDSQRRCGSLFSFPYTVDSDRLTFYFRILQEDSRQYLEDGGPLDDLRRNTRIQQAVPAYNWKIGLGEGDFVSLQHAGSQSRLLLVPEFRPVASKDTHLFIADTFEPPYNTWVLECPQN